MQLSFFSPKEGQSIRYKIFLSSKLGHLYKSLPLTELSALLPQSKNKDGARPWFSSKGKIALQFLKIYEDCSDEKLLERINANWALQIFCGIHLAPNQQIKDKDLIWKTRKYVAEYLSIQQTQGILIQAWKPYMEQTDIGMSDATCYESYIKYPTDVKLLWDCNTWLHHQIKYYSKCLALACPRNKFKDQRKRQLVYARKKRKTWKADRNRRLWLLKLLKKLLSQLKVLLVYSEALPIEDKNTCVAEEQTWDKYRLIKKIYEQQLFHFESPEESVPNRVVSLYKPYLRPIVRGKEKKRVEFGAKVNTWQVSGLNFIEHLSFSAFHEGNRLNNGIAWHKKHFEELLKVAADRLYATNANRTLCKKLNISTSFRPKGRRTNDLVLRKQEDVLRTALSKARATMLEGSYGNDKNHYGLHKVKARNEKTEVAWIFFGMMTANALKIAKRRQTRAPVKLLVAA